METSVLTHEDIRTAALQLSSERGVKVARDRLSNALRLVGVPSVSHIPNDQVTLRNVMLSIHGEATNFTWPPERIERLRQLWSEGLTATDIAKTLTAETGWEYTRNAILGKVHRLKFPGRIQPRFGQSPQAASATMRKPNEPAPVRLMEMFAKADSPRQGAFAERPGSVSLLNLEPHHCRWPFEAADGRTRFCGCQKAGPSSYCEEHRVLSIGKGTQSERTATKLSAKVLEEA